MERLDTKDYNRALRCLHEYKANKLLLTELEHDIEDLSLSPLDGMPKVPYSISDSTARKVIQKEENPTLRKIKKEKLAVDLTLLLADEDGKNVFSEVFEKKNKNKWNIIDKLKIGEGKYKQEKRFLIYTVHKELTKLDNLML